MSQPEFAERVKLSRDAIAKYEGGKGLPSAESLLHISQATGKPMEWFLTGEIPAVMAPQIATIARAIREMGQMLFGVADRLDYESSGQTAKVVPLRLPMAAMDGEDVTPEMADAAAAAALRLILRGLHSGADMDDSRKARGSDPDRPGLET